MDDTHRMDPGTERVDEDPLRATGDVDDDGTIGDPGDRSDRIDAGGGGGTGMTVSEVASRGGGSPGAQAAQLKRERTGEGLGEPADIENPRYPNSR